MRKYQQFHSEHHCGSISAQERYVDALRVNTLHCVNAQMLANLPGCCTSARKRLAMQSVVHDVLYSCMAMSLCTSLI